MDGGVKRQCLAFDEKTCDSQCPHRIEHTENSLCEVGCEYDIEKRKCGYSFTEMVKQAIQGESKKRSSSN